MSEIGESMEIKDEFAHGDIDISKEESDVAIVN